MLKLALLGAGSFSEKVHGPSLAHYAHVHPDEVTLTSVCDLREERTRLFCERFGFQRAYVDFDRMLEVEKPDGCWVIAPTRLTRSLAGRAMEHGVPTFLEKPPGVNLREVQELTAIAERTNVTNMVAFNRRWAPGTRVILDWIKQHAPFEYFYARMRRIWRGEDDFAYGTGIHLLDCVRALAEPLGGVKAASTVRTDSLGGTHNFHVDLTLGSGARGRCDILPMCGIDDETYTLYGRGRSVHFLLPWVASDGRAELHIEGEVVEHQVWPGQPFYLNIGYYGETCEFIAALKEGRKASPSVQEAIDSVALAEAAQTGVSIVL